MSMLMLNVETFHVIPAVDFSLVVQPRQLPSTASYFIWHSLPQISLTRDYVQIAISNSRRLRGSTSSQHVPINLLQVSGILQSCWRNNGCPAPPQRWQLRSFSLQLLGLLLPSVIRISDLSIIMKTRYLLPVWIAQCMSSSSTPSRVLTTCDPLPFSPPPPSIILADPLQRNRRTHPRRRYPKIHPLPGLQRDWPPPRAPIRRRDRHQLHHRLRLRPLLPPP